MNKKIRTALTVILALVFLGSLTTLLFKRAETQQSSDSYREAEALAALPETPTPVPEETAKPEEPVIEKEQPEAPPEDAPKVWREAPVTDDPFMDELSETNLAALREVNEDVLAWIVIPDTQLAYPLMYSGDNDYYLNHTWKKQASSVGSIFLEQHCSSDLSDFNTIVYGHRMMNGSMFGSLKYYNKQDYWSSNPYVYLYDDNGAHRYEIFAAYEASVTGSTYRLGISDDESKQAFLDDCLGWSAIDTGIIPTINDRILTMSTCTGKGYDTRWVVQARLAAAADEAD